MTGRILGPGPASSWYSHRLSCPSVKREGNRYRMYCYGAEHDLPGIVEGTIRFPMGRGGLFESTDGALFTPVAGPLFGGSVIGPSDDDAWFDTFQAGPNDVIRVGDEYRMYYMGCRSTVFDMHGVQRQGVPVRIGLATSPDGLTFTKHQGPADGALMPNGDPGDWDEWFNCFARVIEVDGGWRMYFTGVGPSGHGGVGYAESADGISWQKQGRTFGASGDPAAFDGYVVGTPHVIAYQGGYLLAYEALKDPGTNYRIGLARSDDGLSWTRIPGRGHAGALLDLGGEGAWDQRAMGTPNLLLEPDGSLRLYYVGFSEQGVSGIGLATCDGKDLLAWTKFGW